MSEVAATYRVSPRAYAPTTTRNIGQRERRTTPGRCLDRTNSLLSIREGKPRRSRDFPEMLLHAAWQRAGSKSATLTGRDGHSYRVIYSGRPADGAGPDFRDAVLLRDDGVRLHGHVEVHVRSSDWNSHGHATDSAYNGVVLHVVGEEFGPPIHTPSGIRIPLLVLDRKFVEPELASAEPVMPRPSSIPLPLMDMAAAGDAWFRNRVHAYLLEIADEPEQALWEGALECLGYPSNKKGFRQLATRLPWRLVTEAAEPVTEAEFEQLFNWAAGFGIKPVGAPSLARDKSPEWRARHGRPANSPRVRLSAAAKWARSWCQLGGPSETFIRAVKSARGPGDLAAVFLVSPGQREGKRKIAPLGVSRARDIVVNHMLPAVYALATANGDRKLAGRAKQLFDTHPLLASNSITRETARLLVARGVNGKPGTARDQQGLMHIYRMAVASQRTEGQLPLL